MIHLVVVSDGHQGDRAALCPPESVLDLGGDVGLSKLQEIIWTWWEEFRLEVDRRTRGNYILLVNGDWLEGDHHRTKNAFSLNINDQESAAIATIGPLAERAQAVYFTRGTGAHAGQSGEWEENLAKQLHAVRDRNTKAYARPMLRLMIEDVLVNASHYIGVSSSPAAEASALMAEYNRVMFDCATCGRQVPDLIIRSHRHRHCQITKERNGGRTTVFVTPGWQLKTPYVYGIAGGAANTPHIGGSIIQINGSKFEDPYHFVKYIDQDPIEEVEIAKVPKADRKPMARGNRPHRR